MTISCDIIFDYESDEKARMIKESLSPDNEEYICVTQQENKLVCTAKADTPMQLLHTLDDFMSCITVAEDMLDKKD